MPEIKGLKPGTMSDCICVFAERLGASKDGLVSFVQALIALLQVAKTYAQLTNFTVEDELRKLALQAELAIYEAAAAEVIAGVKIIQSFGSQFSDCAPVGSAMRIIKKALDDQINPIYEREFEIERLIAAINRKNRKTTKIQNWIDWLNALLDAISICGEE